MKKLLLLLSLGYMNIQVNAQSNEATIKRIVDDIMNNGTSYSNLRILCKQVGQRLSGSPQYINAVRKVSDFMKDAGADTVYLQPCIIPHWVRGGKEIGVLTPASGMNHQMNLTALGTSVGTGDGGITGQVIEITSMDELPKLGNAGISGKILFFNFKMNPTYINSFKAYGESGIARRAGPAQASKYGAVGVMVRSLSNTLNDNPHTGVTRYSDSFPKIPAVAISTNDAEFLSAALTRGKVSAYIKTNCKNLPDVVGYNVIGEIRGSEQPNKIITVGGHLDSWDLAEGANDDGSGVVQSIEVLRTLKTLQITPKRTIRAVAFANEEISGSGGKMYLDIARQKKEDHLFALESDEGGFTPRGFSLDMTEEQQNKIKGWKALFAPYGVYNFVAGGSGSDVEHLKELHTALCGLNPDTQRYFDIHHARTDIFENVSERELKLGAANMTALIWLVSEYGL